MNSRTIPAITESFKSPRECYKHKTRRKIYKPEKRVSSPQGNATNKKLSTYLYLKRERFQVPKGMLQTRPVLNYNWNCTQFQVPKGMLQTFTACSNTNTFMQVSSPQGNATNTYELFAKYKC